MTGSAKTRHDGAFYGLNIHNLRSHMHALTKFKSHMQTNFPYKVATTEKLICTAGIIGENALQVLTKMAATYKRNDVQSYNTPAPACQLRVLTIADQRGVALVLLVSIHPTRNEINTRE